MRRHQKYTERHVEKSPEKDITVVHTKKSPIESATGIEGDLLWEDVRYQLRDEYVFEGDKKNQRRISWF